MTEKDLNDILSIPLHGRDGGTFEISANVKDEIISNCRKKGVLDCGDDFFRCKLCGMKVRKPGVIR